MSLYTAVGAQDEVAERVSVVAYLRAVHAREHGECECPAKELLRDAAEAIARGDHREASS